MKDFGDYVERIRRLFVERQLSTEHVNLQKHQLSKMKGRVETRPDLAINLKRGRARLEFFEDVEVNGDGEPRVVAYSYKYIDDAFTPRLHVRFDHDPDVVRDDHPEHHLHIEPLPCADIRFPTGAITLA